MRRDDQDVYGVQGPPTLPGDPETVIGILRSVVTPARLRRIEQVVARRTLSVVPVLEELSDPHNASAILRSADALGVHRVHAIPGPHGLLAAHRVSKGAHRWLDIVLHDGASTCVEHLHGQGYRVVAATMGGELAPEDLREEERVAVVFGNERRGVSEAMRERVDATYAVPMVGFAESLNVSVAAAVTLFAATRGRPSGLSEAEQRALVAQLLMATVTDAEGVVRRHLERS